MQTKVLRNCHLVSVPYVLRPLHDWDITTFLFIIRENAYLKIRPCEVGSLGLITHDTVYIWKIEKCLRWHQLVGRA